MPQACFVPLQETMLAVFLLTRNKRYLGFSRKIDIAKTRFFISKKFHKSKSQKFFDIDKHRTSIICKTLPTKTPRKERATYDNAVTLALYARLQPDAVGYNDFITDATA